MNHATLVTRCDTWMTAWVGDELMMMQGETGAYLSLSQTGGRIWEMLERSDTVAGMCERLASEYRIAREEAMPELICFLRQMAEEGTILLSGARHD